MDLSPSTSAAPDTSAFRTVRATSAASRFCAASSGPQPLQQRRAEQRCQVLGGQGVERGHQVVHDTSHRIDQVFEV
ncbi:hypothetical protein [Geodermatophilus siccatus]|uniref:hypothetical protein n=1 Tax=Geodermatophilus siccatus TaxID=1137991 RepID=UPI0031837A49